MSDVDVRIKTTLLEQAVKVLKGTMYVKVGIQGSKGNKIHPGTKDDKTPLPVWKVGEIHEYGRPDLGIPQRSFLHWPLEDDFSVRWHELFGKKEIQEVFLKSKFAFFKTIAKAAMAVIDEAFQREGSSARKWQALNPQYANKKGSTKILVDTATMRRAISYRIVRGDD